MRGALLAVIVLSGCSFDWSMSGPSGSGGSGGAGTGGTSSGGTSAGGASGASGANTGGVAASTNGGAPGTGGVMPGGGTGGVPQSVCGVNECIGHACNSDIMCDASNKAHCCVSGQVCANPTSATVVGGVCVPDGCYDGSNQVQCGGGCPDVCAQLGLFCCKTKGLCDQNPC